MNEEVNFCSQCGAKVNSGAKFCLSCGYDLKNSSTKTTSDKPIKVEVTNVTVEKGFKAVEKGGKATGKGLEKGFKAVEKTGKGITEIIKIVVIILGPVAVALGLFFLLSELGF